MDMEYRLTAKLLDTMGIALCVFDADDCTVLWNQSFLRYFPEHEGHVYPGEHYGDNLRRFYRGRLPPEQLGNVERYVADGILRNRTQTRPYVFQHQGRWFRASSVPEPGGGRVRIWLQLSGAEARQYDDPAPDSFGPDTPSDPGSLLQNLGEGATLLDAQQRIVAANDHFLQIYGVATEESVRGRTLSEVVGAVWDAADRPAERALYAQDLDAALLDGACFAGAPVDLPLPDQRWSRITINRTAQGQTYAIHWDVSAAKRHELELRTAEHRAREGEQQLRSLAAELRIESARAKQSEQRMRTVFTRSGIPTLVASPSGDLTDVNDALCELLDYQEADLLRLNIADVLEGQAATQFGAFARAEPGAPTRFFDIEAVFYRKDGLAGTCQFFCASVQDEGGAVHHVVGNLLDITQRKSEEHARELMVRALRQEARQDELTGLVNRRYLESKLEELAGDAGCHGLLFVDLDGFKMVNDRSGHASGDEVLRQVAGLLRKTVRTSDIVGRLGGDEFVVLLRDCGIGQATAVARKLVAALGRREFSIAEHRYRVGASIGIRMFGTEPENIEAIMKDADAACYRAKRLGRNRVELHAADAAPSGDPTVAA
ncbi:MAG: diguanylate cyclase [Pseudomonadota bacterium]